MIAETLDAEAAQAAGLTLVGEPLAIDLVNTEKLAKEPPLDLLADDPANRVFWQLEGSRLPIGWEQPSLADARALRSAIRSLLESRISGVSPEASAVRAVNRFASAASSSPQLTVDWMNVAESRAADGAAALLGAVAQSAIDTLTGPTADRLHRCAADDCSMLFVATNAKRQWCTAGGCGNRQRVARHATRQRDLASTSA
jgi:predicted RNA-binding Zn ribbon-like protein